MTRAEHRALVRAAVLKERERCVKACKHRAQVYLADFYKATAYDAQRAAEAKMDALQRCADDIASGRRLP